MGRDTRQQRPEDPAVGNKVGYDTGPLCVSPIRVKLVRPNTHFLAEFYGPEISLDIRIPSGQIRGQSRPHTPHQRIDRQARGLAQNVPQTVVKRPKPPRRLVHPPGSLPKLLKQSFALPRAPSHRVIPHDISLIGRHRRVAAPGDPLVRMHLQKALPRWTQFLIGPSLVRVLYPPQTLYPCDTVTAAPLAA